MMHPDIKKLTELDYGWDGYKGIPVSLHAAKIADAIWLQLSDCDWQFVPGADGSIQMEQHRKEHTIEIFIAAKAKA